MAASRKRAHNLISGIEEKSKKEKRIKKYLFEKLENDPKKFFQEWNLNDMLIKDGHKWTYSEEIKKVCVFLTISYMKEKTAKSQKKQDVLTICKSIIERNEQEKKKHKLSDSDEVGNLINKIFESPIAKTFTLSTEVVHSPIKRLKGLNEKRYKSNRKETISFFLLSIHNHDIERSLSNESIDSILKHFNQQKTKVSNDVRLYNLLEMITSSIANEEELFALKVRKIFFNPNIKKHILPISTEFLSKIHNATSSKKI